jgi:diacylglycerol kinase (ATP)
MRVLLVHNPSAGKGDHSRRELLDMLRLAGHHVTYCSTKSDDFPGMLDEPAELVAIAGGDGTIRKVVTKLRRRDTPIAILPLGTANNIARSLGIKGDRLQLVAEWPEAKAARVDLGLAEWSSECRAFVEAVGAGALAAITRDKVGGKLEGKKRLLAGRDALRERLKDAPPLDIHIEADGRPIIGTWPLIEALNIGYTGPSLPLGARTHPGDGALELVTLPENRREDMRAWLKEPENTKPPVRTMRASRVRLKWSGTPALRVDDQLLDIEGPGEMDISLQKEPLMVLLPQDRSVPPAAEARGKRPLEDA